MERLLNGIEAKYSQQIEEAHRKFPNVSHRMILNMIGLESGGKPNATSNKGAQGLLQLMPSTGRSLGVTNPYDPTQNITAGTHYISDLLKHYNNDTEKALAAYNAGPGRIDSGRNLPAETINYIKKYRSLNAI